MLISIKFKKMDNEKQSAIQLIKEIARDLKPGAQPGHYTRLNQKARQFLKEIGEEELPPRSKLKSHSEPNRKINVKPFLVEVPGLPDGFYRLDDKGKFQRIT